MKYDPATHHRRSIRLQGFDYAGNGAYFITICTQNRKCLFGEIVGGQMQLNPAGAMISEALVGLPGRFPPVSIDTFVVMPNHIHFIFVFGAKRPQQTPKFVRAPLVDAQHPAGPVGAPLVGAQNPVDPVRAPLVGAHHPAGSVGAPLVGAQNPVDPVRSSLVDAHHPADPVRAPLVGAQNPVDPVRSSLVDAHHPADPVGAPLVGAQHPADPVGAPLVGAQNQSKTKHRATTRVAPTVGDMVGAFKSLTTVQYIRGVKTMGWMAFSGKLWQRNYYEHVIRDDEELNHTRYYIETNPARWTQDKENPYSARAVEHQKEDEYPWCNP